MTSLRNIVLPLLTSLTFAGSFIAAKYTTTDLTPLTTTLLRYIIALLFFGILAFARKENVFKVARGGVLRFFLLGLSGIVGYHYFFFASLHHTTVTNSAIINGLSPVVTGIMAAAFIKERLRPVNWLGILVACLGVMILVTRGNLDILTGLEFNRGDLLMLTAVVSWAVYALIFRKSVQDCSVLTITFQSALWGVIVLVILTLGEDVSAQIESASVESIVGLVYMGVAASGVGYFLYNLSIKALGPTKTSGFVYSTVPVITALLALLFFDDALTLSMLVSAVLVIAGIHLALRKNRQ